MKVQHSRASHITYAAMFIALMAVGANLTAFITIGAVPLTFQSVVAVLAGMMLGKKLGALAMIGYILLGFTGAPVFAGFSNGFTAIASPTFGFIISFVFIAYVSGFILENSAQGNKAKYFLAGFAGLLTNYVIGIPYVYFYTTMILGVSEASFIAITSAMSAFFIKDSILVFFTAALAAKLHRRKVVPASFQKAG